MIIILDDRAAVSAGFTTWFSREGVSATSVHPCDFEGWVGAVPDQDLLAIEAFLIGDCGTRTDYPRLIKRRSHAPVIGMIESKSLECALELFAAGVDDVVRKPVHVREILARIKAIRRRGHSRQEGSTVGAVRVFCDGRDPQIAGEPLRLPRRERRILEYLAANRSHWVTKTQIYNHVYGLFCEDINETVVESHLSKLRKRLRHRLGYDPVESERYLGYRLGGAETGASLNELMRANEPASFDMHLPRNLVQSGRRLRAAEFATEDGCV